MKTTVYEQDERCPVCHSKINAASSFEGESPKKGDYTVCASCYSIICFDDPPKLRKLRPGEYEEMDPELKLALGENIRQIHAAKGDLSYKDAVLLGLEGALRNIDYLNSINDDGREDHNIDKWKKQADRYKAVLAKEFYNG